jgi:hypothetical protein
MKQLSFIRDSAESSQPERKPKDDIEVESEPKTKEVNNHKF